MVPGFYFWLLSIHCTSCFSVRLMTNSKWAKTVQEECVSHLPSYSLEQFWTHSRSNAPYKSQHLWRAKHPCPATSRVRYFWQSSIRAVQLTSACHLCGLSCLKNPRGVSQWWEDCFSYKQMVEPECLEDTSCGLIGGVTGKVGLLEEAEMLTSSPQGSLSYFIPAIDTFLFHYQKPLPTRIPFFSLLVLKPLGWGCSVEVDCLPRYEAIGLIPAPN